MHSLPIPDSRKRRMTLKAIFLDFNGVIINDEPIHKELIDEIILSENLRPQEDEFKELCLGRSDRACLQDILVRRGRFVSDSYIDGLVKTKTLNYQKKVANLEQLPIYLEIVSFLPKIKEKGLLIGLVSGALRSEVELILSKSNLLEYFDVIVAGDEIQTSKPSPEGYLTAIERMNIKYSSTNLKPFNCLAIEDTPAGIQAAKSAEIQVIGITNTYPMHMLQRLANWTLDYLEDLEFDRVFRVLGDRSMESLRD
jgi:beta-phosphoglucomutase